MARINTRKEKAVRTIAHYKDFTPHSEDNKVAEWKDAFYEMWRLQMTWGYAYEIRVAESRKNGVYVSILSKECYADNIKGTMEDLGFGDVKQHKEGIMIADSLDIADDTYRVFVD